MLYSVHLRVALCFLIWNEILFPILHLLGVGAQVALVLMRFLHELIELAVYQHNNHKLTALDGMPMMKSETLAINSLNAKLPSGEKNIYCLGLHAPKN